MNAIYSKVNKYSIKATNLAPLHVGSANGDASEVLIDEVTDTPFVQGTSIAGAFSDYAASKLNKIKWFGNKDADNGIQGRSKVVFSDVTFQRETVKLELRTRIRCDSATGTVSSKKHGGTTVKSGQIMNMELVSTGASMSFSIYQFMDKDEDDEKLIENLLAALDAGNILIGGQLSNGCGVISLKSVKRACFDLTSEDGRSSWRNEENEEGVDILTEICELKKTLESNHYAIELDTQFNDSVMVKGNYIQLDVLEEMMAESLENDKERRTEPDAMALLNANKEFIIPGSSIKGVFRNRVEMIARYMNLSSSLIDAAFEDRSKIYFSDAVIENPSVRILVRNAIDKFTGGVRDKALFTTAVPDGNVKIRISVMTAPKLDKEGKDVWTQKEQKKLLGLLLLAARDMAVGAMTIGGDASIGLGFADVASVSVKCGDDTKVSVDFSKQNVEDSDGLLDECLALLGEG